MAPHDGTSVAFLVPLGVTTNLMLNQAAYNDSILGIHSFVHPGITRDEVLATTGSLESCRLKWVEFPQNPFNVSAIGALILLPRSAANLTQELLVCSLGAGWGSTSMNTSSFAGGTTFTTSIIGPSIADQVDKSANWDTSSSNSLKLHSSAEGSDIHAIMNYVQPYPPEKPVIVTEAWANYLNPFLPALNTKVIDALMSTWKPAGELSHSARIRLADWALTGLLATGLASIGATSTLQGDIRTVVNSDGSTLFDGGYWFSGRDNVFIVDAEESKDWVKFRVQSTMNGYAYNFRGTSPKVATTFLLTYCIIVLSHVLYAGITGISSTCCDSIGEVTALAMNSTPTTLLKNTCDGIMKLNIFKLPVRVLAIRDSEEDGEHLELVFGNVDEKNVKGTPIKANRVYGAFPKMAKGKKSD